MDGEPVVSEGAAPSPEDGGMVPANEAAPVVEGVAADPTPAVEPVAGAPVVAVPDVVPEDATRVKNDHEIMNVTPVVNPAPLAPVPTPDLVPEAPAAPTAEIETPAETPASTPAVTDEGPAPAPAPVPADENTDTIAADVSSYEALSAEIEALGHEIADHLLMVELESKRAAYLTLLAQWQESAQALHASRYGARTSTPPMPEFKVMSPCSVETLDWLRTWFGLHVAAAE